MAKSRSMPWASRKASTASSYWKLCRAVTPRRNEGCAAGGPELGKTMGDRRTRATRASGATAPMLAPPPKRSCRLERVSSGGATRRRFLEAAAGAAAATWLAPAARSAAPERRLGTVPFVGEGTFPVDTTIGAGLGQRRALDLSTLSPRALLTPQDRFFIRTGCPDRRPPAASWTVRVHGLVEAPVDIALEALEREAAPQGVHLLECSGNSRAAHFGFLSAAEWTGVALERVLARIRPRSRAARVLVSGFDEHSVGDPGSVPGASWIFGLDQVRASGAFLATQMNGAPLDRDHGEPLRLVMPGWYGC